MVMTRKSWKPVWACLSKLGFPRYEDWELSIATIFLVNLVPPKASVIISTDHHLFWQKFSVQLIYLQWLLTQYIRNVLKFHQLSLPQHSVRTINNSILMVKSLHWFKQVVLHVALENLFLNKNHVKCMSESLTFQPSVQPGFIGIVAFLTPTHYKSISGNIHTPGVKPAHTSLDASRIVASCDLSPHSARNVNVNAWSSTGEKRPNNLPCLFPPRIIPVSRSWVTAANSSFSSCKKKKIVTCSSILLNYNLNSKTILLTVVVILIIVLPQ